MKPTHTVLGQVVSYKHHYSPDLLFPIARKTSREDLGTQILPFYGADIWTLYELSWLTPSGKPEVAIGEMRVPCDSPNIVESKSLKLYCNSLNQHVFKNREEAQAVIQQDVSKCVGAPVSIQLFDVNEAFAFFESDHRCIDNLPVVINEYQLNPYLLQSDVQTLCHDQKLCTHLLKSNCLITSQPDWASLYIHYSGPKIDETSLLKYVISYRDHDEFHEPCVERVFHDISTQCQPTCLSVYARYTRRGGIDINPFRTTQKDEVMPNHRTSRQ